MLLLQQVHNHAAEGLAGAVNSPDSLPADANRRGLNFTEVSSIARGLALLLRQHFPPGSAVILCSPNRPQFLPAFLGILEAQMTVFPLAPDLAGPEMLAAAQR